MHGVFEVDAVFALVGGALSPGPTRTASSQHKYNAKNVTTRSHLDYAGPKTHFRPPIVIRLLGTWARFWREPRRWRPSWRPWQSPGSHDGLRRTPPDDLMRGRSKARGRAASSQASIVSVNQAGMVRMRPVLAAQCYKGRYHLIRWLVAPRLGARQPTESDITPDSRKLAGVPTQFSLWRESRERLRGGGRDTPLGRKAESGCGGLSL